METARVGMAEIFVAKGPQVYQCLGLGSCIGIAALDPISNVSGCVHIMLPEKFPNRPVEQIGKFADTGIEEMLCQMEALGARRRNIKVAYAGGAQVFKFGNGGQEKLQVGARNIEKVKIVCKALGLDPLATDVGGTGGRTMTFDSVSGVVTVRGLNVKEFELSNLRTAVRKVA